MKRMAKKKVMITGVHGLIAGAVYEHFRAQPERYEPYGLARRRAPSDRVAEGKALEIAEDRFFLADMSDPAAVERAFRGMDVVVHMAAVPNPAAPFEAIVESNVIGGYNAFEACKRAGVRRIVYASTVMVSWNCQLEEPYKSIREGRFTGDPKEIPMVLATDPPRPSEPYSASKVWGEALARFYADQGLSALCIRIGWVNAEDRCTNPKLDPVWCSRRDIVQMVERCVNAPDDLMFDVFYGLSDNRYRWADIGHARDVLGYAPQDAAERS